MTAALAASTARRRGTAANVVRIRPVLYSVLKASTPSTPTASTAYSRLSRPGSSGSAANPLPPWPGALASVNATRTLMATGVTTATSRVQNVERTERNLIHSQPITSRARTPSDTAGTWASVALIGPLLLPAVAGWPPGSRRPRR